MHGAARPRIREQLAELKPVGARKLDLPAALLVLDAGWGVGDIARTLARASGVHVTGIDGIAPDVTVARQRSARADGAGGRTRFLLASYHALPFADASFDGVYTMKFFVHSSDPRQGLAEFFRVLRRAAGW
ncbi:class I SAM-dependent methyltransferase [Streptomyces sp. NPDC059928]|uniref:class I SAM-dependent methyltransferase n=1 Tax=unclassified Streptomyces TaxID=2593676 RepID=UPI0036591108